MKLSADLHIHSCLSPCGDEEMTPGNIVGLAALCGLQLIALTDHNTCGNVRAAMAAGAQAGVTVIPGMELTTSEAVHVLCYFPTAEAAEEFSNQVYRRLPDIQNRPEIFGRQVFRDQDDRALGEEPRLLLNSTDISIEEVRDLCRQHGGEAVPAHINKSSDSVLAVLGYCDPALGFRTWELTPDCDPALLEGEHPELRGSRYTKSTDSHWLEALAGGSGFEIDLPENTPEAFIRWLREAP